MQIIYKTGAWLVALALGLMPLAVALALPPVDLGIHAQVEPVAVGLHVLSALLALGLMVASVGSPVSMTRLLTAPVLALVALAVAGAVLSPFAGEAYRSLAGGMEHGVGIVWFAELALAVLGATFLRREFPRAFVAGVAVGAASVAGCIALQVVAPLYNGAPLVPYLFPGYLGPNALLAAVPLLALRDRRATAAALALAAVGLAVSGNRGAMLAVPVAALLWFVAGRLDASRGRALLTVAGPAISLGLLGLVYLAAPAIQSYELSRTPLPEAPGLLSAIPIDHVNIQESPLGTVWQRSVSVRMVAESLAEVPTRIATGRGFGSFQTVTVEHSGEVPGRRFADPIPSASRLYWDGDNKARFHSHNLLLESLLSAGLIGAVAWLGFLAALGRSVPAGAGRAAAALVATLAVAGSFWFLVNAALPLLAMAVASVLPVLPRREGASKVAALATPVLALAMVGAAGMGAVSYAAAKGEYAERFFPALIAGPNGPACIGYHADMMPDRQINVSLYNMFMGRVRDKGSLSLVEILPRLANISNYSCLMREYALLGDVEAMEASLRGRALFSSLLGHDNPILGNAIGPDFNLWIDDIERLLDKAPSRTDLIIPFIDWTVGAKRPDRLAAASRLIPRMREDDPVRHYLASVTAALAGKADEAQAQRQQAMRLGLANITPIRQPALAGAETH